MADYIVCMFSLVLFTIDYRWFVKTSCYCSVWRTFGLTWINRKSDLVKQNQIPVVTVLAKTASKSSNTGVACMCISTLKVCGIN